MARSTRGAQRHIPAFLPEARVGVVGDHDNHWRRRSAARTAGCSLRSLKPGDELDRESPPPIYGPQPRHTRHALQCPIMPDLAAHQEADEAPM